MNVASVDWIVLIVVFILLVSGGALCRRYVKGVADYLVAGRKMRKFLGLSTHNSEGIGLVSIAMACQEGFARGFSFIWLGLVGVLVIVVVFGIFGFVIMRYRETKVMTLAQYFEQRYNKHVRVLSGSVTALSGLLNMAIFPIVGSVFLVHFMGLPATCTIFGIQMGAAVPLMTVMIGLALFFTFIGGMVSVILTDFIQSIVIALALIVGSIVLINKVGINTIHTALQTNFGAAGYNPFAKGSYGALFFLWVIMGNIVGIVFAPQMQRIASTDSAKTARQMTLIGTIFSQGRTFMLLCWGIAALAVMGAVVPEGTTDQMWQRIAPAMFLGQTFPPIIKGLFLSGLIAAFISTVDSYFLSWSTIITNDLICTNLKKPLSPKAHIRLTRIIIFAIAIFLWLFGVVYTPKESIMAYLMLTGSMFHGTGLAVIGGLYWRRGTTSAAFTTIVVLCSVPFLDLLFRRIFSWYTLEPGHVGFVNVCLGTVLYIVISLLTSKKEQKNV